MLIGCVVDVSRLTALVLLSKDVWLVCCVCIHRERFPNGYVPTNRPGGNGGMVATASADAVGVGRNLPVGSGTAVPVTSGSMAPLTAVSTAPLSAGTTASLPASKAPLPAATAPLPASRAPLPAATAPLPAATAPLPVPTAPLLAGTAPLPASTAPLPAGTGAAGSRSFGLQFFGESNNPMSPAVDDLMDYVDDEMEDEL